MKKYDLFLLCAGEGTRLRPFTLYKPKPLIPFLGVPLVEWVLRIFESTPLNQKIVNIHYLPEQIQNYFKDTVLYSDEKSQLLGSGGGVHKALSKIQTESFFYANADEVILPKDPLCLQNLLARHESENALATLLVTKHPHVGSQFGGAWSTDQKTVSQFAKQSPGQQFVGYHFVGIIVVRKTVARYFKPSVQPENFLYETLTTAIKSNEKVLLHYEDMDWFETGNPSDFQASEAAVASLLKAPANSWATTVQKFLIQKAKLEAFVTENLENSLNRIKEIISQT
jgi:mannose-1-phosphate guanylyltransferase